MKNTHWQKHTFASVFCFEMLKNKKALAHFTTIRNLENRNNYLVYVLFGTFQQFSDTNTQTWKSYCDCICWIS